MFRFAALYGVLIALATPAMAFAGMPRMSTVLTQSAKLRFEVISFFLVVLVLSVLGFRWLWNGLTHDFPRLPRLSYGRAFGVIVIWGAAFTLVLAMISGARELMTPGAWKPNGPTYTLTDPQSPTTAPTTPAGPSDEERRKKLDELRFALWTYAVTHEGKFPDAASIPDATWQTPHASRMRYLFVPGVTVDPKSERAVAYEPELFGEHRFVLLANGNIRRVTTPELQPLLSVSEKPR